MSVCRENVIKEGQVDDCELEYIVHADGAADEALIGAGPDLGVQVGHGPGPPPVGAPPKLYILFVVFF